MERETARGPHAWLIPRKELWPRHATQMFFDFAAMREPESGGRRGGRVLRRSGSQKKKRSGEYSEIKKERMRLEESVEGTVGRRGDDDGLAGTGSGSLDAV